MAASAPLIELFMWMNCDPDGEGPGGSTNVFPHKNQLTEAFFYPQCSEAKQQSSSINTKLAVIFHS